MAQECSDHAGGQGWRPSQGALGGGGHLELPQHSFPAPSAPGWEDPAEQDSSSLATAPQEPAIFLRPYGNVSSGDGSVL
jgi:hypothetical protein